MLVEATKDRSTVTNGQSDKRRHFGAREVAFDRPRDFLNNHFVYVVISARARGLSVGVNMNPD